MSFSGKRLRDAASSGQSMLTDKERDRLREAFTLPAETFVDDVPRLTDLITYVISQARATYTIEHRFDVSDLPKGSFDETPEVHVNATRSEDGKTIAAYEVTILFPTDVILDNDRVHVFFSIEAAQLRVHHCASFNTKNAKGAHRFAFAFVFASLQTSLTDFRRDTLATTTHASHFEWHSGSPTVVSTGYL